MSNPKLNLQKGTYVIAVSGGLDSMVLLDMLVKRPNLKLIVAHFDHGIRQHSHKDRELVQDVAKKYNLSFVYDQANLGAGASEAEARKVRYAFLKNVKKASNADAIITAHHRDDVIETAILNILRGTNRRGLSSLKTRTGMLRPISDIDKQSLYTYAKINKIKWNEDETNVDLNYRRNYVRHKIVPRFNIEQRNAFIRILQKSSNTNKLLDAEINSYLDENLINNELNRNKFLILPHSVAKEIMAEWLRRNDKRDFDSKLLDRLVVGAKTLRPRQRLDINYAYYLEIKKDNLALIDREC